MCFLQGDGKEININPIKPLFLHFLGYRAFKLHPAGNKHTKKRPFTFSTFICSYVSAAVELHVSSVTDVMDWRKAANLRHKNAPAACQVAGEQMGLGV